jgi:hypothetical protein
MSRREERDEGRKNRVGEQREERKTWGCTSRQQVLVPVLPLRNHSGLGTVTHAYNPSYLGGRDTENCDSRPT